MSLRYFQCLGHVDIIDIPDVKSIFSIYSSLIDILTSLEILRYCVVSSWKSFHRISLCFQQHIRLAFLLPPLFLLLEFLDEMRVVEALMIQILNLAFRLLALKSCLYIFTSTYTYRFPSINLTRATNLINRAEISMPRSHVLPGDNPVSNVFLSQK